MRRFILILSLLFNCLASFGQTNKQTKNLFLITYQDTAYITSTEELKSNKIPDSVFLMKMLKTLMIYGKDCDNGGPHDDNKPNDGIKCWMINEIPAAIGNLVNLDTLRLTLGLFGRLPKEVSNLKNLRFLDLTDSYMTDIDNLMALKNLNQLLLYGCGLSKLPANIGNLNKLKFIGLVGNNLDSSEVRRIRRALPNCKVYYN
jgi:Leucine-rich repeat (LRR) protein